jgi:hypothetical protein
MGGAAAVTAAAAAAASASPEAEAVSVAVPMNMACSTPPICRTYVKGQDQSYNCKAV